MPCFGPRTARALSAAATVLLVAPLAHAAELFVAGDLGISSATGESSSFNSIAPGNQFSSGDNSDSSQVWGGGFGMAVPMSALLPWRLNIPRVEIPYWPGRRIGFGGQEDWRFPGWVTQTEVAWLGGRDYEITTPGVIPTRPYRTDVNASSVMAKFRLDVPIHAPLTALLGRIPVLEPLSLYGGGGIGVAFHDVKTTDANVSGKGEDSGFAYQIDAGVGYALTDSVQWSVGWRFIDIGTAEMRLFDLADQQRGNFEIDLSAHEFTTSLRFAFWRLPFLEGD